MNKKKISRRDFLKTAGTVSTGLTLTACGVTPASVMSTDLPIPTETLVPTATLTFTPTPIPSIPTAAPTLTSSPTVEVKVADLPQTKAAVDQFTAAMQSAGFQEDVEQIRQGLTTKDITGKDGKKYIIATVHLDLDSQNQGEALIGDYPLMIKPDGEEWEKATLRKLEDITGNDIGTQVVYYELDNSAYCESIKMLANRVLIDGELGIDTVFKHFSESDWQVVIDNWDGIDQILNKGKLPEKDDAGKFDFSDKYYWDEADQIVSFAKENNISSISAQWLVDNIPQEILLLPNENRDKILEFITKTRVIKFKDQISRWGIANEIVAHKKWGQQSEKGKMYNALGWEKGVAQIACWVVEANQNAEPMIGEEYSLETNYENSTTNDYYNLISKLIGDYKAPIKVVGFESHLWVYAPKLPSLEDLKKIITKFEGLGVIVSANEVTINTSKYDAITDGYRKPRNISEDPGILQQQMYLELFQAFNGNGLVFFGTSDNPKVSFYRQLNAPEAKAHLFDEQYNPKSDYFILLKNLYNQLQ